MDGRDEHVRRRGKSASRPVAESLLRRDQRGEPVRSEDREQEEEESAPRLGSWAAVGSGRALQCSDF